MITITIPIAPMGKPRMTRRDKWSKRDCVARYRAYCDAIRLYVGDAASFCTGTVSWKAYFPIPESWSKKKKSEMAGKPHQTKPDRDNCDKDLLDALFKEDSFVHTGTTQKIWDDGNGPRIELILE